jgi:hypothetical protein
VGGVELRATAENSTSIAEIGLRARRIVARDVDNQPALDLLAGIELDRRAVQESITFQTDAPVDVGQLLEISSVGAGVQGTFAVQTVKIRQRSQTATVFEVSVGDVRTSIAERLRQLDRIRTGPKLVVVPPAVVLPDSITSLELQDGAVTELKLAEEAVTTSRIALEAITDDLLVSSGITRIADNAISTPKLQANSVVSATIASNQILTNHISAGQIVGSKIQSGSITSAHAIFAAAAIQSADINTLSASKIATGTLTVGSGGITVAGNISGSLLDNGSVGDVKIASGLSASKITTGTLAVGSGGITVSGNISGSLLDNGSIGDVKIASGLSAAKITTGTLTVGGTVTVSGSINASVCTITNINASNISTGSMSASRLSAGTITASVSINSGGTFTVTDASVLNGVTVVNGTLTLNSTTSALGSVTVSNTLNVNGGGSYRMNGNSVISNSTFEGSNGVNTNGLINTNSVYQRNNVTVINSSSSFVGSGVAVQSNGVGCGGVNIWNGSSYNFGQTATVIGSFTIGGVPKTNLVFQGGVLVSYS